MPFYETDPDEDKGLFTISCSCCEERFHKKCEKVNVSVFRDDNKASECKSEWRCSLCLL